MRSSLSQARCTDEGWLGHSGRFWSLGLCSSTSSACFLHPDITQMKGLGQARHSAWCLLSLMLTTWPGPLRRERASLWKRGSRRPISGADQLSTGMLATDCCPLPPSGSRSDIGREINRDDIEGFICRQQLFFPSWLQPRQVAEPQEGRVPGSQPRWPGQLRPACPAVACTLSKSKLQHELVLNVETSRGSWW